MGLQWPDEQRGAGKRRRTLATAGYWSGSARWIVAEANCPAPSGQVSLSMRTNALPGACRESRRRRNQNATAELLRSAAKHASGKSVPMNHRGRPHAQVSSRCGHQQPEHSQTL
jgi:hypothetical protein